MNDGARPDPESMAGPWTKHSFAEAKRYRGGKDLSWLRVQRQRKVGD